MYVVILQIVSMTFFVHLIYGGEIGQADLSILRWANSFKSHVKYCSSFVENLEEIRGSRVITRKVTNLLIRWRDPISQQAFDDGYSVKIGSRLFCLEFHQSMESWREKKNSFCDNLRLNEISHISISDEPVYYPTNRRYTRTMNISVDAQHIKKTKFPTAEDRAIAHAERREFYSSSYYENGDIVINEAGDITRIRSKRIIPTTPFEINNTIDSIEKKRKRLESVFMIDSGVEIKTPKKISYQWFKNVDFNRTEHDGVIACIHCGQICRSEQGLRIHIGRMHPNVD